MGGDITITGTRYSVNPLYQWDTNQVLQIYGLSLSTIPEIHFTNNSMERAIVRQATMDDAGVITVDVPNSLLQKALPIKVYVCIYEGDAFNTLYEISIPVKARKQPTDYVFVDTEGEIYSFNALENMVKNIEFKQGPKGEDGKTPVKGVDYWTEKDKQEIVNDVLESIPDGDALLYG